MIKIIFIFKFGFYSTMSLLPGSFVISLNFSRNTSEIYLHFNEISSFRPSDFREDLELWVGRFCMLVCICCNTILQILLYVIVLLL